MTSCEPLVFKEDMFSNLTETELVNLLFRILKDSPDMPKHYRGAFIMEWMAVRISGRDDRPMAVEDVADTIRHANLIMHSYLLLQAGRTEEENAAFQRVIALQNSPETAWKNLLEVEEATTNFIEAGMKNDDKGYTFAEQVSDSRGCTNLNRQ